MTNVINQPFPKPHHDFIDDAFANAKFSFLVGGAVGLQSAMVKHRATAVLLDTMAHPGVPASIFKSAAGFAVASVGFTGLLHLCKNLRGEDDSVNFAIAAGALGAAVGANNRSAKQAILLSGAFSVAGGLGDFMVRQLMGKEENKAELHSTVDYIRFEKNKAGDAGGH